MTDLKALSEAAAPGPWAYRPNEHDDWGVIRGAEDVGPFAGLRRIVARSHDDESCADYDAHRAAGTDPRACNGEFIVALVNAFRAGRLVPASYLEALTPSGHTKAAYIGEFSVELPDTDEDGSEYRRSINVPWTTIKEIMAAIKLRAETGERS